MRVLVLGATGFVGTHLCARLRADGHEVVGIGREECWVGKSDAIVNCAGQLWDPVRMVDDNLACVADALDCARKWEARYIQVGSSSETGPVEGARSESTPCNPSNLYEATKLAATHLCLGYAQEFGLDAVVARPFSLYGPGDTLRKLLPTLARHWVAGTPITIHPGGHDWLHVDDFIEGLVLLLRAPVEATKGQVYHFGTGISTDNVEVASQFNWAVGGSLQTTYAAAKLRPYDVMDWRSDSSKARAALGWTPKVTLREGITRFAASLMDDGAPGL